MPRGGARPGAGRKKGSVDKHRAKKSPETMRIVQKAGRDPLEVIAMAMDTFVEEAIRATEPHRQFEMLRAAAAEANKLADFIHPRRTRVDGTMDVNHRHADVFEDMERRMQEAAAAGAAMGQAELDEDDDIRESIERARGGAASPVRH